VKKKEMENVVGERDGKSEKRNRKEYNKYYLYSK